MTAIPPPASPPAAPDPAEILRSRRYVGLIVLGALVGAPIAFLAYFFLTAVSKAETGLYTDLPRHLGYHTMPNWWPLPWLVLGGLLVAVSITYLPGTSGHEPSEGFKAGGPPVEPNQLYGIVLAAFATLVCGAVLGPEAPLIAMGTGLGVLGVHLLRRDAPQAAVLVIGAAGAFAAISTLLGSPLVAAFLMMEIIGLGGPMMEVILIPGLLAAGIGALIFTGLDHWTGFGSFSLAITGIPHLGSPTGSEFGWALVIGVGGAIAATVVFRGAVVFRGLVAPRRLVATPLAGLVVGVIALVFAEITSHSPVEVLFSGQTALPDLVTHAATWSAGALVAVILCKSAAYSISLGSFRGGPIFPSMFIGAAGGILCSHAGGLPLVAGAAMGVGAMAAGALKLPLTSTLLPLVLFPSDAVDLTPIVIVAVVVAYVVALRLEPAPAAVPAAATAPPSASPDATEAASP